jgi:RNA polymerase sigma-70 factor (ECF subfamily)
LFTALHPTLVGDRELQPYAKLADNLGMQEGAVKAAVHRLRKRYRQLLREEIGETMAESEDIDEELRHLFAALAGR